MVEWGCLINNRSQTAISMQMFRHHSYVMWVNPIITCLPSEMRATYAATDTVMQMQRYRYKHGKGYGNRYRYAYGCASDSSF